MSTLTAEAENSAAGAIRAQATMIPSGRVGPNPDMPQPSMQRNTLRFARVGSGRRGVLTKNAFLLIVTAVSGGLFHVPTPSAQAGGELPAYLDPKRPVEERIGDLMSRMTLKEKVGQLNLPCVYVNQLGKDIPSKMEACRRFAAGTYTQEIGPGCGFFTLANEILHNGARQQADYFNEIQKIALTQTRLKIPLLEDEEGTHGAMFPGATIFPEGLAIGSTFDPGLVRSV